MDQACKRRGRPVPDAININIKPLAFNLEEALAVESLYRPNLLVIQQDIKPWEVTLNSRDAAVQNLRFLRVWFDVPHTIFFASVTYLDLFLSRMKVQEKYLACVTISCFHLALMNENVNINVKELLSISQNKFSIKDVLRMSNIIREKLKVENKTINITTCADILKIYLDILDYAKSSYRELMQKDQLLTRLEVLLSDSSCAFFRSSTLSLALLKLEVDKKMQQAIASKSVSQVGELLHVLAVIREIQVSCKIKLAELVNCSNNALKILKQYDNQERSKHSQPLKWRFSSWTLSLGKRCRNYQLSLDPIEEKPLSFHKRIRT